VLRGKVPANIVAGVFGFDERKYFEAEAGAETAPTVDFSTPSTN
jgi:LemA protein